MAGEHSYLRFSDQVVVENAGTDIFHIVPPFPEFNRKLGAPLYEGYKTNSTTWVREFEYCKVTLNVDAGIADIEWRSQPNSAPWAHAQRATTDEGTPRAIVLTGSDIDGNPLTYTITTQPAHGTLSGMAPNVTYTPAADYNGADSFTFKVNDGTVDSLPGTVSIAVTTVGVVYQGDFSGTNLASAGLATSAGVNGTWILDTANDWVTGTGIANARANLYTTNSWQSREGFTLNVTFKNNVNMVRYALGIVDADYPISASGDWLNSALIDAYGIGFSTAGSGTNGDYLGFNNGSSVSELSSAQGNITLNTPQTLSITVTPNSWSYSLNGAPATTGSFVTPFDTTRNYRFIAHAQDLRYQNISNITLTSLGAAPLPEIGNMSLAVLPGGASNMLQWNAVSGCVYNVYWSSNLVDGFTLIKSDAPGGVFPDTNHADSPAGFYKITVGPEL
jgi:hypothetical protein